MYSYVYLFMLYNLINEIPFLADRNGGLYKLTPCKNLNSKSNVVDLTTCRDSTLMFVGIADLHVSL